MIPVLIVGADALALRVCEELCEIYGCSVSVLWSTDHEIARRVTALGARYIARNRPEELESLRAAGVTKAAVVMLLSTDDHCNVQTALRARDMNPSIRIVLRQYNRQLGRKIEQNLENCSVLSRSMYAAATYAAAAIDPHCFYALQFPSVNGALAAFSRTSAKDAGIAGLTPRQAEQRLHARVITAGEALGEPNAPLAEDAETILFRAVRAERKPSPGTRMSSSPVRAGNAGQRMQRFLLHLDPVVRAVIAIALAIFSCATFFFCERLQLDPLRAAYFVLTTMTTTGYGDITPPHDDALSLLVAMLLMISGVFLSGMFVAIVATRLTRAQWISMHGLRKIRQRGHFVVCGAGSVGSRVIDFLLQLEQYVVVIEAAPSSAIVERSRDRHFDLLTGDATEDATLELCNLEHALGLIALTESDTLNLEAALGARAYNASLPIVMRVIEGGLASSITRHFGFDRTFGSAALAAPAFAGLAFHPSSRGRLTLGGAHYMIRERDNLTEEPPSPGSIPICVLRDDAPSPLGDFSHIRAGDHVLFLEPIPNVR